MPMYVGFLMIPHFYPRPPRGGRLLGGKLFWMVSYFYPRPPRGGRRILSEKTTETEKFLSTPSARRATDQQAGHGRRQMISIHALREEGDQFCLQRPP